MINLMALSLLTMGISAASGFGFIVRKVNLMWFHLVMVMLITYMLSVTSLFIGQYLTFIPLKVLEVMVGLGMLMIGILLIRLKPIYPGSADLILLVAGLQLDVILLSFYYVRENPARYSLSFALSIFIFASLVGGMVLAQKRWSNWRFLLLFPYLPSILFMVIGIIKILY